MFRSSVALALLVVLFAFIPSAAAASSVSGTLIVLNKSDDTASLLDRESGSEIAVLPTGSAPHEAAVSPDGKLAVVTNYGPRGNPGSSLTFIDVKSASVTKTVPLTHEGVTYHRPHGLKFTPDGKSLVVTVEGEQAVLVLDMKSAKVSKVLKTDQRISHMLDLGAAGRRAFVANIGSGTMTALDLFTGKKIADISTGEGAEGIATSPDGSEVWVTNRGADTVSILDAESLEILATLESPSFPIRAAFTPGGDYVLVSCARSGDVAVFDAKKRKLVRRVSMQARAGDDAEQRLFGTQFGDSPVPIGILIPADGLQAYVANTNADIVTVIDLKSWAISKRLTAGKEPDGLAFSPMRAKR